MEVSQGETTTVSVFSANRAGTLVEVRSCWQPEKAQPACLLRLASLIEGPSSNPGFAGSQGPGQLAWLPAAKCSLACVVLQVVMHFTELGLNVRSARISSDGGWFVDVFTVTENDGSRVKDQKKLNSITTVGPSAWCFHS